MLIKYKERICFKSIAISIACLILFQDLSFALPSKEDRIASSTLAAASRFGAIPGLQDASVSKYIDVMSGRFTERLSELAVNGMSARGLQAEVEKFHNVIERNFGNHIPPDRLQAIKAKTVADYLGSKPAAPIISTPATPTASPVSEILEPWQVEWLGRYHRSDSEKLLRAARELKNMALSMPNAVLPSRYFAEIKKKYDLDEEEDGILTELFSFYYVRNQSLQSEVERPLKKVDRVKKVLVVIVGDNGFGDELMQSAVVERLHNTFPECRVDGLVNFPSLWRGRTDINILNERQIPSLSKIRLTKLCTNVSKDDAETFTREVRQWLKKEGYDLVLSIHSPEFLMKEFEENSRSTIMSCRFRNRHKYNFIFTNEGKASRIAGVMDNNHPIFDKGQHSHYWNYYHYWSMIFNIIGLEGSGADKRSIYISKQRQDNTGMFLLGLGVDLSTDRNPFIFVNPFTAFRKKEWGVEKWSELIAKLSERGYQIAINRGDTSELSQKAEAIHKSVLQRLGAKALSAGRPILLPSFSQERFIDIIYLADLLVSHDGGAVHVRDAFERPALSVWGATDPQDFIPPGINSCYVQASYSKLSTELLQSVGIDTVCAGVDALIMRDKNFKAKELELLRELFGASDLFARYVKESDSSMLKIWRSMEHRIASMRRLYKSENASSAYYDKFVFEFFDELADDVRWLINHKMCYLALARWKLSNTYKYLALRYQSSHHINMKGLNIYFGDLGKTDITVGKPDKEGKIMLRDASGKTLAVNVRGHNQDKFILIGNRAYRLLNGVKTVYISKLLQDPSLWVGNIELIEFFGEEKISFPTEIERGVAVFSVCDVPQDVTNELSEKVPDYIQKKATDYLNKKPEEQDAFLRAHYALGLFHHNSGRKGIMAEAFKASVFIGPHAQVEAVYKVFELTDLSRAGIISPHILKLFSAIREICWKEKVASIETNVAGMSVDEQKLVLSRLKSLISTGNIEKTGNGLYIMKSNYDKMRHKEVSLRVDGDRLVVDLDGIVSESRDVLRSERNRSQGYHVARAPPRDFSEKIIEALVTVAINGNKEIAEKLYVSTADWTDPAARNAVLFALASNQHIKRQEAPIFAGQKIGVIRGGFGSGGASSETEELISLFADPKFFGPAQVEVAAGFYHPSVVLRNDIGISTIKELDRDTYTELTKKIFDANLDPKKRDDVKREYEEAVKVAKERIADWLRRTKVSFVLASQVINPSENPILYPAIIDAAAEVNKERATHGLVPIKIFMRHNYFAKLRPSCIKLRLPERADQVEFLIESETNADIFKDVFGFEPYIMYSASRFSDTSMQSADIKDSIKDDHAKMFRRFLKHKYGVPEDAILVLSPSRLNKFKRIDRTLYLADELQKRFKGQKDVHVLILGMTEQGQGTTPFSGDEAEVYASLKKFEEALDIKGHVHYLGYLPRDRVLDASGKPKADSFSLYDAMLNADVVSQMSEFETFGRVYAEAISSASAVVLQDFSYPYFERYQTDALWSGFDIFMMNKYESDMPSSGMIDRLYRTLKDRSLFNAMVRNNFLMARRSGLNLKNVENFLRFSMVAHMDRQRQGIEVEETPDAEYTYREERRGGSIFRFVGTPNRALRRQVTSSLAMAKRFIRQVPIPVEEINFGHDDAQLEDEREAARLVNKWIIEGRKLDQNCLKELHRVVTANIPNMMRRGEYCTPEERGFDVRPWMDSIFRFLDSPEGKRMHPIERAVYIFSKIVTVHPFKDDGNGRVARLAMNYILGSNGYEPFVRTKDNSYVYDSTFRDMDEKIVIYLASRPSNVVKEGDSPSPGDAPGVMTGEEVYKLMNNKKRGRGEFGTTRADRTFGLTDKKAYLNPLDSIPAQGGVDSPKKTLVNPNDIAAEFRRSIMELRRRHGKSHIGSIIQHVVKEVTGERNDPKDMPNLMEALRIMMKDPNEIVSDAASQCFNILTRRADASTKVNATTESPNDEQMPPEASVETPDSGESIEAFYVRIVKGHIKLMRDVFFSLEKAPNASKNTTEKALIFCNAQERNILKILEELRLKARFALVEEICDLYIELVSKSAADGGLKELYEKYDIHPLFDSVYTMAAANKLRTNKFDESIKIVNEAIRWAERYEKRKSRPIDRTFWANLFIIKGAALRVKGDLYQSIELLSKSLNILEEALKKNGSLETQDMMLLRACTQNLAGSYLNVGEFKMCRDIVNKVLGYKIPIGAEEAAYLYSYLAISHIYDFRNVKDGIGEAKKCVAEILKISKDRYEAYLLSAFIAYLEEDYRKAIEFLTMAKGATGCRESLTVPIVVVRGMAMLLKRGAYEGTEEELLDIIFSNPRVFPFGMEEVTGYLVKGDYDSAASLLNERINYLLERKEDGAVPLLIEKIFVGIAENILENKHVWSPSDTEMPDYIKDILLCFSKELDGFAFSTWDILSEYDTYPKEHREFFARSLQVILESNSWQIDINTKSNIIKFLRSAHIKSPYESVRLLENLKNSLNGDAGKDSVRRHIESTIKAFFEMFTLGDYLAMAKDLFESGQYSVAQSMAAKGVKLYGKESASQYLSSLERYEQAAQAMVDTVKDYEALNFITAYNGFAVVAKHFPADKRVSQYLHDSGVMKEAQTHYDAGDYDKAATVAGSIKDKASERFVKKIRDIEKAEASIGLDLDEAGRIIAALKKSYPKDARIIVLFEKINKALSVRESERTLLLTKLKDILRDASSDLSVNEFQKFWTKIQEALKIQADHEDIIKLLVRAASMAFERRNFEWALRFADEAIKHGSKNSNLFKIRDASAIPVTTERLEHHLDIISSQIEADTLRDERARENFAKESGVSVKPKDQLMYRFQHASVNPDAWEITLYGQFSVIINNGKEEKSISLKTVGGNIHVGTTYAVFDSRTRRMAKYFIRAAQVISAENKVVFEITSDIESDTDYVSALSLEKDITIVKVSDPSMVKRADLLRIVLDAIKSKSNGNKTTDHNLMDVVLRLAKNRASSEPRRKVEFFDKRIYKDDSQIKAVEEGLDFNLPITLVKGPSGTGKTSVTVELIKQFAAQGLKVLVVSQTNQAVDNIGLRLQDDEVKFIRVGNNEDSVALEIRGNWAARKISLVETFLRNKGCVVLGTINGFPLDRCINHPVKECGIDEQYEAAFFEYYTKDYDVVIVEEAGKATVVETLYPLSKARKEPGRSKGILVGDNKQLPAFGVSDDQKKDIFYELSAAGKRSLEWLKIAFSPKRIKDYKTSLFENLWESSAEIDKHLLLVNRRSHPFIAKFVSDLFYDGTIKPDPEKDPVPEEDTIKIVDYRNGNKSRIRCEEGDGQLEKHVDMSCRNLTEANIVLDEVDRLLNQKTGSEYRYQPKNITIITPYKSQIALIRHALEVKAIVADIFSGKLPKEVALSDEKLKRLRESVRPNLSQRENSGFLAAIDQLKDVYGNPAALRVPLAIINKGLIFDVDFKYGQRSVTWDGLTSLKLFEVETVDSIQGSENDVVILSLVRSNRAHSIGFMGSSDGIQRLTVAFSRARQKMTIIGDFSGTLMQAKYTPRIGLRDGEEKYYTVGGKAQSDLEMSENTDKARRIFVDAFNYVKGANPQKASDGRGNIAKLKLNISILTLHNFLFLFTIFAVSLAGNFFNIPQSYVITAAFYLFGSSLIIDFAIQGFKIRYGPISDEEESVLNRRKREIIAMTERDRGLYKYGVIFEPDKAMGDRLDDSINKDGQWHILINENFLRGAFYKFRFKLLYSHARKELEHRDESRFVREFRARLKEYSLGVPLLAPLVAAPALIAAFVAAKFIEPIISDIFRDLAAYKSLHVRFTIIENAVHVIRYPLIGILIGSAAHGNYEVLVAASFLWIFMGGIAREVATYIYHKQNPDLPLDRVFKFTWAPFFIGYSSSIILQVSRMGIKDLWAINNIARNILQSLRYVRQGGYNSRQRELISDNIGSISRLVFEYQKDRLETDAKDIHHIAREHGNNKKLLFRIRKASHNLERIIRGIRDGHPILLVGRHEEFRHFAGLIRNRQVLEKAVRKVLAKEGSWPDVRLMQKLMAQIESYIYCLEIDLDELNKNHAKVSIVPMNDIQALTQSREADSGVSHDAEPDSRKDADLQKPVMPKDFLTLNDVKNIRKIFYALIAGTMTAWPLLAIGALYDVKPLLYISVIIFGISIYIGHFAIIYAGVRLYTYYKDRNNPLNKKLAIPNGPKQGHNFVDDEIDLDEDFQGYAEGERKRMLSVPDGAVQLEVFKDYFAGANKDLLKRLSCDPLAIAIAVCPEKIYKFADIYSPGIAGKISLYGETSPEKFLRWVLADIGRKIFITYKLRNYFEEIKVFGRRNSAEMYSDSQIKIWAHDKANYLRRSYRAERDASIEAPDAFLWNMRNQIAVSLGMKEFPDNLAGKGRDAFMVVLRCMGICQNGGDVTDKESLFRAVGMLSPPEILKRVKDDPRKFLKDLLLATQGGIDGDRAKKIIAQRRAPAPMAPGTSKRFSDNKSVLRDEILPIIVNKAIDCGLSLDLSAVQIRLEDVNRYLYMADEFLGTVVHDYKNDRSGFLLTSEAAARLVVLLGAATVRDFQKICGNKFKNFFEVVTPGEGRPSNSGYLYARSLLLPTESPLFTDLQDFTSGVMSPKPGEVVLDLLSGPGGEAMNLAARHPGVKIYCLDSNPLNIYLGIENVVKRGLMPTQLQFVMTDALKGFVLPDNSVDKVIIGNNALYGFAQEHNRILAENILKVAKDNAFLYVDFCELDTKSSIFIGQMRMASNNSGHALTLLNGTTYGYKFVDSFYKIYIFSMKSRPLSEIPAIQAQGPMAPGEMRVVPDDGERGGIYQTDGDRGRQIKRLSDKIAAEAANEYRISGIQCNLGRGFHQSPSDVMANCIIDIYKDTGIKAWIKTRKKDTWAGLDNIDEILNAHKLKKGFPELPERLRQFMKDGLSIAEDFDDPLMDVNKILVRYHIFLQMALMKLGIMPKGNPGSEYDIKVEGNYSAEILEDVARYVADYSREELLLESDMWDGMKKERKSLTAKYEKRWRGILQKHGISPKKRMIGPAWGMIGIPNIIARLKKAETESDMALLAADAKRDMAAVNGYKPEELAEALIEEISKGGLDHIKAREFADKAGIELPKPGTNSKNITDDPAWIELQNSVRAALKRYSNVHRGKGRNSIVSTKLYEEARRIILDYYGLPQSKINLQDLPKDPAERSAYIGKNVYGDKYHVIFGDKFALDKIIKMLPSHARYHIIFSNDLGLPLGVGAIVIMEQFLLSSNNKSIPPPLPGGGTVDNVQNGNAVWKDAPDKYEAGTPNIIGAIALAKALLMIKRTNNPDLFKSARRESEPMDVLYGDDILKKRGEELLSDLKTKLIATGPEDYTKAENGRHIYFDSAASTLTFEPVLTAFKKAMLLPKESMPILTSEVRKIAGEFFGAPPDKYDVVFTQNTTHALNMVAEEVKKSIKFPGEVGVVLNSVMEHSSNRLPWRVAEPLLYSMELDVDKDGFFNLKELEARLEAHNTKKFRGAQHIGIVSLSGASNVLGSVNDMRKIADICHRYGAKLLVDAAQLAAHKPVDMESLGIDYLVFSAHKMYAPFGSGAVIARKGLLKDEVKAEDIDRINIAGIAALGEAMLLLKGIGMDIIDKEERELTAYALEKMGKLKNIYMHGSTSADDRRIGVISFEHICGFSDGDLACYLHERANIDTRNGCLCVHDLVRRMLVDLNSKGVVRVSFGLYNTKEDVDTLVEALQNIDLSFPSSAVTYNKELVDRSMGEVYGDNAPADESRARRASIKLAISNIITMLLQETANFTMLKPEGSNFSTAFLMNCHSGSYNAWASCKLADRLKKPAILIRQDEHDDTVGVFGKDLKDMPRTIEDALSVRYSNVNFTVAALYHGLIDEIYMIDKGTDPLGRAESTDSEIIIFEANDSLTGEKAVDIFEIFPDENISLEEACSGVYTSIRELKRIKMHRVAKIEDIPDLSGDDRPILWDTDMDWYPYYQDKSAEGKLEDSLEFTRQLLRRIKRIPDVSTFAISPEVVRDIFNSVGRERSAAIIIKWLDLLNDAGVRFGKDSYGAATFIFGDEICSTLNAAMPKGLAPGEIRIVPDDGERGGIRQTNDDRRRQIARLAEGAAAETSAEYRVDGIPNVIARLKTTNTDEQMVLLISDVLRDMAAVNGYTLEELIRALNKEVLEGRLDAAKAKIFAYQVEIAFGIEIGSLYRAQGAAAEAMAYTDPAEREMAAFNACHAMDLFGEIKSSIDKKGGRPVKILDVGGGNEMTLARIIKKEFGSKVEVSVIDKANQLQAPNGVRYIQGDANQKLEELKTAGESFDIVISTGAITYFGDDNLSINDSRRQRTKREAIALIRDILAAGGIASLNIAKPLESIGKKPGAIIKELKKDGFEITHHNRGIANGHTPADECDEFSVCSEKTKATDTFVIRRLENVQEDSDAALLHGLDKMISRIEATIQDDGSSRAVAINIGSPQLADSRQGLINMERDSLERARELRAKLEAGEVTEYDREEIRRMLSDEEALEANKAMRREAEAGPESGKAHVDISLPEEEVLPFKDVSASADKTPAPTKAPADEPANVAVPGELAPIDALEKLDKIKRPKGKARDLEGNIGTHLEYIAEQLDILAKISGDKVATSKGDWDLQRWLVHPYRDEVSVTTLKLLRQAADSKEKLVSLCKFLNVIVSLFGVTLAEKDPSHIEVTTEGVANFNVLGAYFMKKVFLDHPDAEMNKKVLKKVLDNLEWAVPRLEEYVGQIGPAGISIGQDEQVASIDATMGDATISAERLMAIDFKDSVIRQAVDGKKDNRKTIIALGTDFIPGYSRGQSENYADLNKLVVEMRHFCDEKGIAFIDRKDGELAGEVERQRAKEGYGNARVLILAKADKDGKVAPGLIELTGEKKIFGVDSSELTPENYIRIMEMLRIGLDSIGALDPNNPPPSPNIPLKFINGIWIFFPKAEPIKYDENQHSVYTVQRSA